MRTYVMPRRHIMALSGLLILLGLADTVHFVDLIQTTGSWRLGTQLLLLPAGLSLLGNTVRGLRFARGVVVVSMLGTLLFAVIGAAVDPHPMVSLGAAAPVGSPWWGFLVAGALVLCVEAVALVWIGQALRERTTGSGS